MCFCPQSWHIFSNSAGVETQSLEEFCNIIITGTQRIMRKYILGITVPMNRCPLLLIIVSSLLSAWGNVIYEGLCNPAHRLNNINVHRQYVERSTKPVSLINICGNNEFNNISNADTGFYYLNLLTEIQQHKRFFSFTTRMPFLHLSDLLSRAQLNAKRCSDYQWVQKMIRHLIQKKRYWKNFKQNTLIYNSQMYYFLSNYINGLV